MTNVNDMTPGDDFDEDALIACVDLVQRSGARDFEVGHLHENVPVEQAGWYAYATYGGARLISENHLGPTEATEGLARRILRGAMCTHCNMTVSLGGFSAKKCRWTRNGRTWVRGCEKGTET